MVLGHYAAAFIARPHLPFAPFWLLLVAANLPEFLWLVLALAGVEPATPDSILDATFSNLKVQMTYSHNLVPAMGLSALAALIIFFSYKNKALAIWCFALSFLHVLCDYIVGFEHEILGITSPKIGLNSYGRFPHMAIVIEFLFAMACLTYFTLAEKKRGASLPVKKVALLFLAFSIGILAWLPNATLSMRQLLGL